MPFRYLSAGVLLSLVTLVAISGSRSFVGPSEPIDAAFFGMHVHRALEGTPWPDVPFAGWRLWDAHVTWPQLEPERDRWDFSLLDGYTRLAAQHHAEILLTLGLTPAWASMRLEESSAYARGNAAPPRLRADWQTYIRTVGTRYKGVIHNYEIWNEPNVKGTYTGSVEQILELSQDAYRILKSIDPTVTMVSPSPTASDGVAWLDDFLKAGGCQYADVIGYHFYVTPDRPESVIALIQRVKAALRAHHCENKPLWNTESGWAEPKHFSSDAESAGYLMRAYLLNWLVGVQRCYWYAWDNHNWSTLNLTSRSNEPLPTANAYGVLQAWLVGAVMKSCARQRSGLWICQLDREGSVSRIVWSDDNEQVLSLPRQWHVQTITTWNGQTSPVTPSIGVGPAPMLLN